MDSLHLLARRIRALFRPLLARRETEADLDEEMRFHLDAEIAERVRRGMTPDAARTAALRDFGGVSRFKEECRDAWGTRVLDELSRDARYGLRSLRARSGVHGHRRPDDCVRRRRGDDDLLGGPGCSASAAVRRGGIDRGLFTTYRGKAR